MREKVVDISTVQKKRLGSMLDIMRDPGDETNALFLHSALCQTYFPFDDRGQEIEHTRRNGNVVMSVDCQKVVNPKGQRMYLGLPYGPKARLAMLHISTKAIQQQSAGIEVENSMTRFVTHDLGLSNDGRTINAVKTQLARLSASSIQIALIDPEENRVTQFNNFPIKGFDLWFPKDENQHVLWPSVIQLSDDYFNSLMQHAIPHDMRMVAALANSALRLDILSFLTQRLHRVKQGKGQFVTWKAVKDQFGVGYSRMDNFKRAFRKALRDVLDQYQDAKIEEVHNKGFMLYNSPPPVPYMPSIRTPYGQTLKRIREASKDKKKGE